MKTKQLKEYEGIINGIKNIPNIGQKGSERIFEKLLISPFIIDDLINVFEDIKNNFSQCDICFSLKIKEKCIICDNEKRKKDKICIVSNIRDSIFIDINNNYNGQFHILNGELNIKKGIIPDKLTISNLLKRLKEKEVKEIIFALNTTFEGELTFSYIKNIIKKSNFCNIKLTKLSQGLPLGGYIEYIDENTLMAALNERKKI